MAISGAALALIVAGTAVVSAHPGDKDDQRGFGKGRMGAQSHRGDRGVGPGLFGQHSDRRGGPRVFGQRGALRGELRQRIGGMLDQFVRSETTVAVNDGFVTHRVDQGTVTSASDAGLEYTLADGQSASVTTDDDTKVWTVSVETVAVGRRGRSRQRLVPQEIAVADIEPDSRVVIWAQSQDDGAYLAQRVGVQPVVDEAAEEIAEDVDAAETEDVDATEDAAASTVSDA